MMRRGLAGAMAATLALGACAVAPTGPSVMALPPQGKSFAQFQNEDLTCRNYAATLTGGASPAIAAQQSGVASAALGTLLGAAAGAAIGAAAGNPAAGAAIGAGTGLVLGAGAGANNAAFAGADLQRGYDIAYTQCMFANGNQVVATGSALASGGVPAYAGWGYAPAFVSPTVLAFGLGGWGWGGWGWGGGGLGWNGWRGGWNGGNWNGGGWRGGGWSGGGWHR